MKKSLSLILSVLMILSTLTVLCGALNVYDADAVDICKNGQASLDIFFKKNPPTLDGKVNTDEYYEIPYESVKDYYVYYIGTDITGSQDQLYRKLLEYVKTDMKAYGCWDGKYFYFALTAKAKVGEYICPKDADSVFMYRYWCTQCGFAAPDAQGTDRFEVGLGASSDNTDDCYGYGAWGQRQFKSFKKGENFFCHWDKDSETVTYEIKVDIAEVTGTSPKENSQMRFLYLLAQSGQGIADGFDRIQIQCSYGCADEKRADWFVMLNFKGLPEDVEIQTGDYGEDDETEQPGYWGKTDFSSPDIMAMLDLTSGGDAEFMTDPDGQSYVRFTATADDPTIGGKNIPIGLNARDCKFMALKYRTSSKKAGLLGMSYASNIKEELTNYYTYECDEELGCDGKWHTIVLYMQNEPTWSSFIMNMRFWLFADQKDVAGETFDIAWLKYYTSEPEFDDIYDPFAVTTAEETTAAETEEITTTADSEADVTTDAQTTPEINEKSGCGNVISLALISLLIPCLLAFGKRKRD